MGTNDKRKSAAIAATCLLIIIIAPTVHATPAVPQGSAPIVDWSALRTSLLSVATVIAALVAIFGGIAKFFKPVRNWIANWFRKLLQISDTNSAVDAKFVSVQNCATEESVARKHEYEIMRKQGETVEKALADIMVSIGEISRQITLFEESNKGLLRDAITAKYYKYRRRKAIPIHEMENLERLYSTYEKHNGNSYVGGIVAIMRGYEILSGDDLLGGE